MMPTLRWLPFLGLVGCAYTLGRVPPVVSAVQVAPVHVASSQPGLGPELERALVRSVGRRVELGEGPVLRTSVLAFEEGPASAGGGLWRVSLEIQLELDGIGCVSVADQRVVLGGNHATVEQQRQEAVVALAQDLAEQAVSRLLVGAGAAC